MDRSLRMIIVDVRAAALTNALEAAAASNIDAGNNALKCNHEHCA